MKSTDRVRIVLVRPKESRNVGSVCRAMKNCGFSSLWIVMDGLIDPNAARTLAHNAEEVLENAVLVPELKEAVADASLVVGTTRRRGKKRKYFSVFPEQLAERVAAAGSGTVAVLFGNEDTGLTDAELGVCHLAVTIPASAALASLNLSHAVQVVCYELFRALTRDRLTPFSPIPAEELEELVSVITRSLKAIGFFYLVGPENMSRFFKDILGRAGLSVNEARRLGVVFRKIAGLITKGGIDPGSDPP